MGNSIPDTKEKRSPVNNKKSGGSGCLVYIVLMIVALVGNIWAMTSIPFPASIFLGVFITYCAFVVGGWITGNDLVV